VLDPNLVPTPLDDARETRLVEVTPPAEPPRFRRLHLVRRFTGFALWVGWRRLRGGPSTMELAVAVRTLFESLGGLWIKLGQLVAMRRDLLPADFCSELGRLQDRVTGFPGAIARAAVEADLGRTVDSLFSEFEDHPFAAASIGQLHRARVRGSGRSVAVKVRRPHIEEAVEGDLAFVRGVCRILDALGVLRDAHLSDFLQELDPERVTRWLAANKIKPGRVGRLLHSSLMRQIVEDNLFHGDLHPGNIVLLRESRVALVDFGSIGSLESRFRTLYRMLNRAMSDLDFDKVSDIMSLIAPSPDPGIDWDRVRRQASIALRRAEVRAYAPNHTYHERSMTTALLDVARSLAGSGFPIGWAFMRVDRAHVTLDASLTYLVPDVGYLSLGQRYWKEARSRALGPALRTKFVEGLRRARAVSGAGEIAERIEIVGDSLREGATSFRRSTRHAEQVMEVVTGMLRWAVLALAAVGAMIVAAREMPPSLALPVRRAVPALLAAAPALHWSLWLAAVAALVIASLRLAAVERSFAQHPRESPEDRQRQERVA